MSRLPRLTVYRAADGWRWNYRAANGRIMADSAEAYTERDKCLRAACQVFSLPLWLAKWPSHLPPAGRVRVVVEDAS